MDVTGSSGDVTVVCDRERGEGRTVGFVPTMGALHGGHAELLARARAGCDVVVASIFVNPLQFGPSEDLASYPRSPEADAAMAAALGCELLFTPDEEEMYPNGAPAVTVDPGALGRQFEGASRPGHFVGVLTVVANLFGIVGPCAAYFGEKDAQQLELVRRMTRDLRFPVTVEAVPTVREPDGLAISSRNVRLGPEERAAAPALFDALTQAAALARQGERDPNVLRAATARTIGSEPLARLDYVAVVDDRTWEEPARLEGPCRALAAMRVGSVRLIDNLLLPWPPAQRGE